MYTSFLIGLVIVALVILACYLARRWRILNRNKISKPKLILPNNSNLVLIFGGTHSKHAQIIDNLLITEPDAEFICLSRQESKWLQAVEQHAHWSAIHWCYCDVRDSARIATVFKMLSHHRISKIVNLAIITADYTKTSCNYSTHFDLDDLVLRLPQARDTMDSLLEIAAGPTSKVGRENHLITNLIGCNNLYHIKANDTILLIVAGWDALVDTFVSKLNDPNVQFYKHV